MSDDSQVKSLHENNSRNLIIRIGAIIIFSALFLIVGVFGITFGTTFLGSVGILLVLWGIFKKISEIEQYKTGTEIINKIVNVLFVIWIISFLIIQGLIIYSASSNEEAKVDYVLVLGAGLRGEEPSITLARRLNKSLEYLERNPDVKAIVSGGQGPGETIPEAEAMKRFLMQNGIAEQRIIKEEKSTSTNENIIFTKQILDNVEIVEIREIAIISSEFHLFRAKLLARRNGFIPYGIPAETPKFILVNYLIREYFAVVKSLIFNL